ncbi:F-BAR domain only protein 1 isoform X1 [Myotis myotis]|uniref:F-BAR domain only protein 1 isoform X1 n=1 Tax=Myotis myotis TaxID=51298 RepID=UPI00174ABD4D|nr:F-BAR domain only protein 1 isoform X1 [Myotis myotis]XP_036170337.1 F-BAR domain only protein 1 isoform X1 [Myotis myotis]XP_036170338.1 F-BAR domain only protein 1 isoform X1 [Myotis myotis]XP_036170339.1 F-BAR domain only protein 1 isoform X1 [Myotis myotis]XP_036170340.1 F-BAR domain only protein 1 isoform X1 [Myotis myotis]XP_036170341.1 F-BAR domain only protein 1 isoform X1 [Myotis myotis]XP_036170342.1 F-BAR domain only protein 1 isoform X1 [Myotis myotis]XP_036170343.1 F-BAR doma
MSYFGEHFWGEKNHGFEVLYHNMKQGPISTKELAEFIRERATIEETYSKAMAKLSKLASNGTPVGTFAPLWEVFRVSSDKLALCHLELTRKLQDLIKDVLRYSEEQLKMHKKLKEEAGGTLDAVQVLAGVSQLLPKSRENYLNRCMDQERLRRESTSQKEMDKAETKTKKAADSLRRSVEKYNSARADFEQKMLDSALHFQTMEETHLRHMKTLLGSYAHSVEDTHVQIGQVHEEFKQNIENISVEVLLRKFAESKGTGREKPVRPKVGAEPLAHPLRTSSGTGPLDFEAYSAAALQEAMKRLRGAKAFRLPGLSRREREPPAAVDSLEPDPRACAEVDEEGFTVRPDVTQNSTAEPSRFSSSDSDFDDEEPRKFYVHIKPAPARAPACSPEAAAAQLRATAGSLILPPGPGGTMKRHSSRDAAGKPQRPRSAPRASSCTEKLQSDELASKTLFGPPLESAFDHEDFTGSSSLGFTSSPSPFSSSSPENVEDSGLDSPSHAAPGPFPDSWALRPGTPQSPPTCRPQPPPESRGTRSLLSSDSPLPLAASPGPWGREAVAGGDPMPGPADLPATEGLAAPPRRPRSRKVSCPLVSSNGDLPHSLSSSPLGSSVPGTAPERCSVSSQTGHGISRGPSPVVLGSQDALPVATVFTEYVHAYFRGHSPSCLARVTGELTMTFPAGIVRVFSGTPPPPVLSFRLVHTTPIEHFQPNADLLFSDPSQSDPETKDFWLNMTALTEALQRQAEQNPAASYYNVVLLRYQFSRPGPQSVPLQLSAHWQCEATLTQVSVEYSYRPGATAVPTPLTNVQILLPVGEPVTNVRLQPAATWNLEEKRFLWKLPDVSEAGGSGRLSASWEPCSGPSTPSPVAAQFTSEGATLSGVDVELVGSGYRMSLVKRRFATGMYLVSC